MSATPKVKRNLETLIYRVKELAFANDALDSFWPVLSPEHDQAK